MFHRRRKAVQVFAVVAALGMLASACSSSGKDAAASTSAPAATGSSSSQAAAPSSSASAPAVSSATSASAPVSSSGDSMTSASDSAPAKHLTIGSILYGVDGYQVAHGKAMEAYGSSIGVNVKTCNSNNSLTGQQKCVQDMISAKVDGIIIQPFEPVAGAALVKQIQAAGIPVITWAIGPVPGVTVPFVDLAEKDQTYQAGQAATKWVKEHFNASPQIVDLSVPNNTNCSNREGGFIAGATAADPATVVVAKPNGGGVRLNSQNAMSDVIQSGKKFNIVTGCNGESTLGALAALRAVGRGKAVNKVPTSEYLFSVDGTSAEVTELLNPSSPLMSTLALTPKTNTKALLDDLLNLINKKITDSDNSVHLTDQFLTPDCTATNALLKDQYGTTVSCP